MRFPATCNDAADLETAHIRAATPAPASDGHGRTIATTERAHLNGAIDAREVRTQYLPQGNRR